MNIGNILIVADAIERSTIPGLGFNMGGWKTSTSRGRPDLSGHSCGTVACIAGWVSEVVGVPMVEDDSYSNYVLSGQAGQLLGLTVGQQEELFTPEHEVANYYSDVILPVHAVRVLRNLAITGKVDWEAAMKDDEPILPQRPAISPTARLDRLAAKLNQ